MAIVRESSLPERLALGERIARELEALVQQRIARHEAGNERVLH
jgi:hypothetical protein